MGQGNCCDAYGAKVIQATLEADGSGTPRDVLWQSEHFTCRSIGSSDEADVPVPAAVWLSARSSDPPEHPSAEAYDNVGFNSSDTQEQQTLTSCSTLLSLMARKAVLDDVGDGTLDRVYSEASQVFGSLSQGEAAESSSFRDLNDEINGSILERRVSEASLGLIKSTTKSISKTESSGANDSVAEQARRSSVRSSRRVSVALVREESGEREAGLEKDGPKNSQPIVRIRSKASFFSERSFTLSRHFSSEVPTMASMSDTLSDIPGQVAKRLRNPGQSKLTKIAQGRAKAIFQALLVNGNGQVQREELRNIFQACFGDITQNLFKKHPTGCVSQQEFVRMCGKVKSAGFTDDEIVEFLSDSIGDQSERSSMS